MAFLAIKGPAKLRPIAALASTLLPKDQIEKFLNMSKAEAEKYEQAALAKKQYLAAALALFAQDLKDGEAQNVLRRSLR